MKNTFVRKLAISLLVIGLSPLSWGKVIVVTASELPVNCQSIGLFESNAGYGKSLDGPRVALRLALTKASKAGACHAIVRELNRGITDLNGYSLVEGFTCQHDHIYQQQDQIQQQQQQQQQFEYGYGYESQSQN